MSKTVNYTPDQEAALKAFDGVFNSDICRTFADDFGKSHRSVISKVKSLNLPYELKAKPAAKKAAPTKAAVVLEIESALHADAGSLEPLAKAPMLTLVTLRDYVKSD